MPLYDFVCSKCGLVEELLVKHSDPNPETCSACGQTGTLSREIGNTSFQLKGPGWSKDLYGTPPVSAAPAAEM